MPTADPAGALSTLLEEERRALLAGDLSALSGLVPRKDEVEAAIRVHPPGAAALTALRAQAARNARLLAAAATGVRRVAEALQTAQAGGHTLATYDAAGQTLQHGSPPPRLSVRA